MSRAFVAVAVWTAVFSVLFMVAIWTGDERYGATGAVVVGVGIFVGPLLAMIVESDSGR